MNIPQNYYLGDYDNIRYGRVLALKDFKIQEAGTYWIDNGSYISVVTLNATEVKYELGRIEC
ncbi:tRNA pseudouridine synthase B [hydrothermal vent metagenome]|uniref:tRNA pseudouridine synthase B n=1 Tax=hydrothermal vent metagenome TaxID=652676 RepID=A0A1W1CZA3_9ZZZZ